VNLHLLRIFAAVAEQRSFSRAAATMHISQPAVSKAVSELERQLDLTLLERSRRGPAGVRGTRLTDDGQALYEHARGIFALERAAADEMRARVELERGRLTIGASTTIAGYWLPAYLAAFSREHPGIQLQVRVGNTQSIAQALIDCEIDLALVEGPVSDARIASAPWRDEDLAILTSPGTRPRSARRASLKVALEARTWLLRERGSGTREVTDRLMRSLELRPARTIEIASNEAIAHGVAAGLGVALLPARVARELLRAHQVEAIVPPSALAVPLVRPLYRLQLQARPASPLARAFAATLEHDVESQPRERSG